MSEQHRYNTLWLSDVHLGHKDCKADFLIDLLTTVETDTIFLVGDIVDFWALSKQVYWPGSHHKVIQLLIEKAAAGCKVIYIPGNHDDPLRDYCGMTLAGVEIHQEYYHTTADGKRLLLVHGDMFDAAVHISPFISVIGDHAYSLCAFLNRWFNRIRGRFGFPYWSLATYLKTHIKKAAAAIERFRDAAINEAKQQGVDGIVCGHIHHAEMREEQGVLYCNDGDWVESCTVLVEHPDGRLELLDWAEQIASGKVVYLKETERARVA